ncbi:hypothetical protein HN592_02945 [Candidatus Woesearchaeota archaeon]|jgi:predicted transcriptional regulator|nr:hypothetical protein [Candidatus Woesearchaeota archaeon]MBT4368170.1 hypothetical protein [Candidatus Woesearchaeota archaeon]MBT4712658.1 hypothetical protein [Candidatus Woesearchaeota archaeon]MBT6639571.1 hypothetical protein [Candidatus Woesearchaeota archaeon]MBT7133743.1 hypothetical protein [Candidatus Woesearchaeota archaeon]
MAKKRERLEVIRDILKVVNESGNSIKPTPLLRKSNMSTKRFNEYFTELQKKELVKEIITKKGKEISLTEKGMQYLNKYSIIKEFVNEFGL